MTKENDITSIRIPKHVKVELGKIALAKESYHVTIQRLIQENHQLKKTNERNDDLIALYKEKSIGIHEISFFAKKVCEEYLVNSKDNHTLDLYKMIIAIITSDNSFKDKIKRLKEVYMNDNTESYAFMCALDYCALNVVEEDIILFNEFLSEMLKNNPYDNHNHYEWIKWNAQFNKQYELKVSE